MANMDLLQKSMNEMKGTRWADYPEDDEDWLNSLYTSYDVETPMAVPVKIHERKDRVDRDDLLRWASWTKPFPLPDHMVPLGDDIFGHLTEEQMLEAPAHMLVHLQRTNAQGGLQIISPRQIPITNMMCRVGEGRKELGDHVVGSVAAKDDYWPTIDGATFEHLLPDQPLACVDSEEYQVQKTRSEPLTSSGDLLRDPVVSCLVKGRAVIDIQNREDVAGDGDRLAELLANAWGVTKEQIMEMDAFTLGVSGPLLRHAIKSDEVFAMVHAPIHMIKSVSVSCSEATRGLLPAECAMDWRRMRTVCEAVFLNGAAVEGLALRRIRAIPPPGDPSAPLDRPGTMAFRPAPCTAWSFEARSFSVNPVPVEVKTRRRSIPRDVLLSMSKYMARVKPVSHVLSRGGRARTRATYAVEPRHQDGENISEGYRLVARSLMVGSARGKNAARTVRSLMHDAIAGAPLGLRLRIARYIHIAKTEVKAHLGLTIVPDAIIDRIAAKFLKIGDAIRQKLASEAARRNTTVEVWWSDIIAKAPECYKAMTEGTMGWAKVAMWLTFRAPSQKWENMERTIHYTAIRDAEVKCVTGIPLPPELGSMSRLVVGTRAMVKSITAAYFGYYCAVSDVGMAIADMLTDMGQPRKADILREATYLWVLRARALRGTNVDPISHAELTPSYNHLRVFTEPVDLLVVPAPYRAFEAYRSHVLKSEVVHKSVKRDIQDFEGKKISDFFSGLRSPLAPAAESLLTRYLLRPYEMQQDLEGAWGMLRDDVGRAAEVFLDECREKTPEVKAQYAEIRCNEVVLERPDPSKRQRVGEGMTYSELMAEMDIDMVEWLEDILYSLPKNTYDLMGEMLFEDVEQMRRKFLALEEMIESGADLGMENVV